MLRKFWELANHYEVFVTFNGRSFDMRLSWSARRSKGVRPTKDLMQARYPWQQRSNVAVHVDLLDTPSFYGAVPAEGKFAPLVAGIRDTEPEVGRRDRRRRGASLQEEKISGHCTL